MEGGREEGRGALGPCVCVWHPFICVLFMCRVFLDNCIFHSLCSSLGQQQGEEVRQTEGVGGAGDHLPPLHLYLKTQHKKHCWH